MRNAMTDPPWGDRPPRDAFEAVGAFWHKGREVADERKRVAQAVRDAGHGKTRAQLRSLLEEELNRREMPSDPIWVERKLDELEWSPGERAKQTAHRLRLVGGALGRIAQSRGIPEAPEWMRPPDDAGYHVRGPHREKTPVDVDPDAALVLDRALAGAPGHVGDMIALVEVWFDREAGAEEDAPVAVRIGAHSVGVLDSQATKRLIPVMQAAAERGEKPCARAQLAKAMHLRPPYLLVVDLPVCDEP